MRRIERADRRRGRVITGLTSGSKPTVGVRRDRGRNRLEPDLLVLEDRRLLATITVTSMGDTLGSNNSPTAGTLRWAVEQANLASTPSTIDFNLGSGAQTVTLAQLLDPVELTNTSEAITISGPGASLLTIDGHGEGAVLRIDAGVSAKITGLTVTDASLDLNHNGGAISNLGTLSISQCTLSGNSISGIYDDTSATATINDCTITGNNSFSGAGVFVKGTATITGCTISGNSGSNGAGISNDGTTTVKNCTITGNSTGFQGGVYNVGQLSVYNSTITGNKGGGLYNNKGTMYVSGCTITGNSGFIDGGGLNNQYGATLTLSGCTVSGNSAETGGGLYNKGTATITDSTLSGNTATGSSGGGQGGGVSNGLLQNKAVLTITGSTLSGNTAKLGGGGLFNNGTATLTDCTFADNFANQAGSLLASNGGGVDNSGTATLLACTVTGNTTTADGGGLYNGGLGVNIMSLEDTIVAGNSTTARNSSDYGDIGIDLGVTTPYYVSGSYDLVGTGGSGGLSAGGHNLLGVSSPGLGPLASNGGPTQTVALLPASPAIYAGIAIGGATTDQRGDSLDTPTPDIGAYQTQPPIPLSFSNLTNPSIVFGTSSVTLGGTLSNGSQVPTAGETVSVTLDGDVQTAPLTANGTFSAGFDTTKLTVKSLPYPVTYSYTTDGVYASASTNGTLTVTKATPYVSVSDPSGSYDGSAFAATATIYGVGGAPGSSLETVKPTLTYYPGGTATGTPLNAAPSTVGTYTVVASFAGSADYTAATSQSATFTIAQATPTVSVSDPNGSYNGSAFAATATVTGAGGAGGSSLETVKPTLAYYPGDTAIGTPLDGAPTAIGMYTVVVSFAGSTDYTAAAPQSVTFNITQATPTVNVSDSSGTYDGSAFVATATVAGVSNPPGPSLEGVAPTAAYYTGGTATGNPLGAAPTAAGTYTVIASFAGSTDYVATSSSAVTFTIARAAPKLSANATGGPYDGSAFTATASVAGLSGGPGASLEGIAPAPVYYTGGTSSGTPLNGAPTAAGTYTVVASFPGSADYAAGTSQPVTFAIAKAAPTVSANVTSGTYDGSAFDAMATVTGLSGPAGASLEGVTPAPVYDIGGTSSGTPVGGAPTAAGTYTVVASFPGSADYAATSSSAVTFTIAQATPTVNVNAAGGTFDGSAFVAAATVTGVSGPAGASLEGVAPTTAYYTGGTATGTPLGGAPTAVGTYTVVASFAGSTDYATAASQPVTFTIAQATPIVKVNAAGGTFDGSGFAATATVTGVGGPAGANLEGVAPAVTYYTGDTAIGTPLAGAPADAGTYTVVASFAGSTDYAAATSQSVTFTIAQATPGIVLIAPDGTFDGSPIAASTSIAGSGGTNSPAASLEDVSPVLTYYIGSGTSGTSRGSTPPTVPGTYTVVASFPGTADYSAIQSAPVTFSIARATPASVTLAPSGGAPVFGQSITFTATVSAAGAAPGGTITFFDGTTPLGTAPLDGSGKAVLTTTALGPGAHAITAGYGGDSELLAATSGPVAESVSRAGTQVVLMPQPVFKKKKVVSLGLKVEVQPTAPGAGVPTGTVTFEIQVKKKKKVTEKVLGTATLGGGSATLSMKPKSVLKEPITIVYAGDSGFTSGTITPPALTQSALKSLARPMLALSSRGRTR